MNSESLLYILVIDIYLETYKQNHLCIVGIYGLNYYVHCGGYTLQ